MPTAFFRIVSCDVTGQVTDGVKMHVLKNGLVFCSKSQILPRYFQFILTYIFSPLCNFDPELFNILSVVMILQKKEVLGAEIGCESCEQCNHIDRKFQKTLQILSFPNISKAELRCFLCLPLK
jgi:hypothetical protein